MTRSRCAWQKSMSKSGIETRSGLRKRFEQQVIAQGIEAGDVERVGHQRAGARASPGPHRAAVGARPVDEVGNDQEIAGKAHLPGSFRSRTRAARRSAAARAGAPRGRDSAGRGAARVRHATRSGSIPGDRHLAPLDRRRREVGQLRSLPSTSARLQRLAISTVFAPARARQVGEERLHLRLRLEILLAAEPPRALRIGEHLAFGDADARVVRLVIVGPEKLHAVRRHHWQAQLRGQLDRAAQMRLACRACRCAAPRCRSDCRTGASAATRSPGHAPRRPPPG